MTKTEQTVVVAPLDVSLGNRCRCHSRTKHQNDLNQTWSIRSPAMLQPEVCLLYIAFAQQGHPVGKRHPKHRADSLNTDRQEEQPSSHLMKAALCGHPHSRHSLPHVLE